MSSAREFAAQINRVSSAGCVNGFDSAAVEKLIEQRDADREKELKAQLDELSRYKRAIDFHLCANDKTDWLGCNMDHGGYCDVCESDPEDHQHKRLAKLEAELARYKATCEALATKWMEDLPTGPYANMDADLEDQTLRRCADELRSVLKAATEGCDGKD